MKQLPPNLSFLNNLSDQAKYHVIHERNPSIKPMNNLVDAIRTVDLLAISGDDQYDDLLETLERKIEIYFKEKDL